MLSKILHQVVKVVQSIVDQIEAWVKEWTKPTSESLIAGVATALIKSKSELVAENAFFEV